MEGKKFFIIKRWFVFVFVAVQLILVALVMYAILAPKTITVHVQQSSSYDTNIPISVKIPLLK